jgi:hypothetical protein
LLDLRSALRDDERWLAKTIRGGSRTPRPGRGQVDERRDQGVIAIRIGFVR